MHPVAQYREDNDFLKQNAGFLFKYRELIQGHAWFPYVPVPLEIPGIKQVPLGALLELAGNSRKVFCRLCEDAAWWEPIIMDRIPDKLVVVTEPDIDIESPSSLFQFSKSPMEERADAEQAVIRNRIRALSELCAQYNQADAVPPKADLREVVFSLKRAGSLAYLTDEQVEKLRNRLHAFNVYDSLEEMENHLVDDFLDDLVFSCCRGACATFRPEYFQYYWSRVQYPVHFTARYAKDRNVVSFRNGRKSLIRFGPCAGSRRSICRPSMYPVSRRSTMLLRRRSRISRMFGLKTSILKPILSLWSIGHVGIFPH